ncbi:hypothetical protein P4O66_003653 [Electrophorus voltai]|uniref:Tf2-1-like SH3-like domain-containing protein n=1 Tax=Electrophorus voltai TaxID=2609070 RepID=A0AAD9E4I3_9TELE|nr:hypothetical protein P4O66_003653 [Electrophorus voltai]
MSTRGWDAFESWLLSRFLSDLKGVVTVGQPDSRRNTPTPAKDHTLYLPRSQYPDYSSTSLSKRVLFHPDAYINEFLGRSVVAYIEDILIYCPSWDQHVHDVRAVLGTLLQKHLYCKVEKCEFHRREHPDPSKLFVVGIDASNVGQKVWVSMTDGRAGSNGKLAAKYEDPYTITRCINEVTYCVGLSGNSWTSQAFHVSALKLATSSESGSALAGLAARQEAGEVFGGRFSHGRYFQVYGKSCNTNAYQVKSAKQNKQTKNNNKKRTMDIEDHVPKARVGGDLFRGSLCKLKVCFQLLETVSAS